MHKFRKTAKKSLFYTAKNVTEKQYFQNIEIFHLSEFYRLFRDLLSISLPQMEI